MRTYTITDPRGRSKLLVTSGCFVVVGFALAIVTVGVSLQRLVAGALDEATGTLVFLVVAALVAGIGLWIARVGYYDEWQFNLQSRTAIHRRRRLFSESVENEVPFESVMAVTLSKTVGDDFAYSVDLSLKSGQTESISHDRSHASELAKLLDVPLREK
jgi:hypothetical protein